jgi:type IV secretion system protein TrbL
MVAGGAAIGGARLAASAGLGGIRAGTSMGAGAATAYSMGQQAAGDASVRSGLGGVARATGNAARARASGALGLGDAAAQGRDAARAAFTGSNSPPPASGGGETPPAWARAIQAQQVSRHRRQLAVHAIQQGDRGGGSLTPDINERNE